MPVFYASKQGQTVDMICHLHYGRTRGVTEAVLAANQGLAEAGPILPIGTEMMLPDAPALPQGRKLVALWE